MAVPRYREVAVPFFSAGFRPFFSAAGIWACLAMAIWSLTLRGVLLLPTLFDPVSWHFHEMLFGFVTAAIAGFLLTAIPNWTGRLPLQGLPLALLVLLWAIGRLAVAGSAWIGALPAAALDLSFLVVFAFVIGREILAGRNWRNLPILAAVSLLILANTLIHAGLIGYFGAQEVGKRLALSIVVLLIGLIGGRIIPSFTTNWLRRRAEEHLPVPFNRFDQATLVLSIVALGTWTALGLNALSGATLIAAATLHVARLGRWRGSATRNEPLLWVLHLGYAFVPVGLFGLGAAAWMPALRTAGIHALTAGAMGIMILAMMTRASLGHTKRSLTAGRGTLAAYLLVLLAALSRMAAPSLGSFYEPALDLAAASWIAGYALFLVLYGPLYMRPDSPG